jgi:hypothetical protein
VGADPVILMRLNKAFLRSRVEYGAFSFHKLKKIQVQKVENTRITGLQSSTPTSVMLAEAREIPILNRFKQFGSNYAPSFIRRAITQWSTCWKNYLF